MTVVVSIATSSGIVIASDSMQSSGAIAGSAQKVRTLDGLPVAWAGAGAVPILDDFDVALRRAVQSQDVADVLNGDDLDRIRELLGQVLWQTLQSGYSNTLPHGMNQTFPNGVHVRSSEFLIGGYACSRKWVLHCDTNGGLTWVSESPLSAIGSGGPFAAVAQGLMSHYLENADLALHHAQMIAFRAVETTCAVSSGGVGGEVQVGVVDANGARILDPAERDRLKTSVAGWKQVERDSIALEDGDVAPEVDLSSDLPSAADEPLP